MIRFTVGVVLLVVSSILVNVEGRSISQFLSEESVGTKWAVLVAGSKGWLNYRHQANVCHAYQLLREGGLKDENIIVFMYDDIANNKENPRPGVIINNPHGQDVYKGVPKDYVGKDVNAKNFFNVILANKSGITGGSGKILSSGPNDNIFIYYADHGGPGIIGMPTGIVHAIDLINVLKKKHASGTYSKMVFYLEACESGSMFDGLLPEGLDIYVTTASKPDENSWGTYCGVTGKDRCLVECPPPEFKGVCLGDLYSVAWMEDSDVQDRQTQSLNDQYARIAKRTAPNLKHAGSHVMQYGDMDISFDTLDQYMGAAFSDAHTPSPLASAPSPLASAPSPMVATSFSSSSKNVDQRDTDLFFFMSRYQGSAEGSKEQSEAYHKLNEVISQRNQVDNNVKHLGELLFGVEQGNEVLQSVRPAGQPLVDNWDCLKSYVKTFEAHCGTLTSYGKKYIRAFANICNAGITSEEINVATAQACHN